MFNNYYNSKVTVELRELVENGVDIWDFEYPSYYQGDEKTAFEKKVIGHYYFRQIGQETVGRFLHHFRAKVREIMPYYIDLYHSAEIFKSIEDPLQSYELTETFTKSGTSNSTSSGSSSQTDTANNVRKFSDTPHGRIENLDTHLTEGEKNDTNGTSTGTTSSSVDGSDSEEYELHRFGNIGVQPLGDEIQKLRQAYINIDMMIIDDLNDLFLKVY